MFFSGNKQVVNALRQISFDHFTDTQVIPSGLELSDSSGLVSDLNRVLELYYSRILWECNNVL